MRLLQYDKKLLNDPFNGVRRIREIAVGTNFNYKGPQIGPLVVETSDWTWKLFLINSWGALDPLSCFATKHDNLIIWQFSPPFRCSLAMKNEILCWNSFKKKVFLDCKRRFLGSGCIQNRKESECLAKLSENFGKKIFFILPLFGPFTWSNPLRWHFWVMQPNQIGSILDKL